MDGSGDLAAPSEQVNWVLIVGNELCGKISLRERKFQEDLSRKFQDEEFILKKTEEVLKNTKIMKKELNMTENLLKMKLELIAKWELQVQTLKTSQNALQINKTGLHSFYKFRYSPILARNTTRPHHLDFEESQSELPSFLQPRPPSSCGDFRPPPLPHLHNQLNLAPELSSFLKPRSESSLVARRARPESFPVATKQLVQNSGRQTSRQEGLVVEEEVRVLVQRKVTFAQSALQLGGSKPERIKPVELQERRERSPLHRTQVLAGSRFKSHLNQDQSRRDEQVQRELPVSARDQPKNPVLSSNSDVGLSLGSRSSLFSLSMSRDRGLGYSGIRNIVNSFTMDRKV